ncbi:PqqD family peptide modification chaperone [Devosia marina]|uniref:Cyclic nucleotide-binding domain-containing protein n=1 Tax=Devosia marina TaxID=2683198 RepID=A0A7X3FQI8_9HYPH|nr:PqqD family peptide modification chaperone [Devosia marina]MVS98921.1 cyclic nucleotide-binding domain-containing protein [Devosia marina]
MFQEERVNLLRESYLFGTLPIATLKDLAEQTVVRGHDTGAVIFSQGEPANLVHLPIWGTIEESVLVEDDRVPIALLTFADVAGEECLRTEGAGRYASTAVALEECATLCVPTAALADPAIASALAPALKLDEGLRERMLLLRRAAPFAGVGPAALQELAAKIQQRKIKTGTALVEEGRPGDTCYLIHSGTFSVHKGPAPAAEQQLAVLGPGSLVGEVSLLAGEPRRATVTALEDGEVLAISRSQLERIARAPGTEHLQSQVALRIRPRQSLNVELHRRKGDDGEAIAVLKHTTLRKYFQLSEFGTFVWEQLDGSTRLTTIIARAVSRFGTFSPQGVINVVQQLLASGFATLGHDSQSDSPLEGQAERRGRGYLTFDLLRGQAADDFSESLYRAFAIVTRPVAVIVATALGLAGLVTGLSTLTQTSIPTGMNLPYLATGILALAISLALHEAAHILAMKAFGLSVHGIGIGVFWFYPIAYVDTSDTWIASSGQRVMVALAGPLANIVFGGIAALVAANAPASPLQPFIWVWSTVNFGTALLALAPNGQNDGAQALRNLLALPPELSLRQILVDCWNRQARAAAHLRGLAVLFSLSLLHLVLTSAFFYLVIAVTAGSWFSSQLGTSTAPWIVAGMALALGSVLSRGIASS